MTVQNMAIAARQEESILQLQRMESVVTLAGGIAHDLNNMLTVIIGACSLLEMRPTSKSDHDAYLGQIRSAADRAANLTQSLLAFSRKQAISMQQEDLAQVIRNMQTFLGRSIGDAICFSSRLPPNPVMVMVDRGQIEQVLMNLAANSRDSMPNGGNLNISLSVTHVNEPFPGCEGFKPGEYALISVTDTGTGMDKATQQRIFEPFFSTKEPGSGIGLGMSVAYGIVRKHDGIIQVQSEPGEGTIVKIFLPLQVQPLEEPSVQPGKKIPKGTETILVVEDDPAVLDIHKVLLEKAGYMVLSASDGVEALELYRHGSDRISLVVLDVIMSGMSGTDVYEHLRSFNSGVKVLFASGYTSDILDRQGIVLDSRHFISKPLNPGLFLNRVRTLIDS